MARSRAHRLPFALAAVGCALVGILSGASGGDGPIVLAATEDADDRARSIWERRDDPDDRGPRFDIDERTGDRLTRAQDFVVAEDFDRAEKELGKLLARGLNPLERTRVHQIRAFIAAGRDDYAEARRQLEAAIAEEVAEPREVAEMRFQIAQLWLQEESWTEAVKELEYWFTLVENPNPSAYYTLALAYYQLDDFEETLRWGQQALDHAESPKESWLQLVLACRLTRKEYEEAVPILEQLVAHFPSRDYWVSLSTVHGALGNYEKALAPLQVAYAQGLLSRDAELRRLAQMLLFLGLPFPAARVLEQGLEEGVIESDADALEMLSNSWVAAREFERAIEPLERAASFAESGNLYVRLAHVHVQQESWEQAAAALAKALEKGGLDNRGDAELLMGIAHYSQERPLDARQWFDRARRHATTRKAAETWIDHIDRELRSG